LEEFVPNIDEAKKCIQSNRLFSEYSSVYVVTNEDLRLSMKYMPKNCNKALVAAASGDHPLFCSLCGAKHVDTFDISYNAKCLTDIKVAALKHLDHTEYLDLLEQLHYCYNVMKISYMDKILQELTPVEIMYLDSMNRFKLFDKSEWKGKNNPRLPSEQEYQIFQKIIRKPYNFIMSNITTLSTCLVGKYDFIHCSNIFDYILIRDFQTTILSNLLEHVNVGGRILIQHLATNPWQKTRFNESDLDFHEILRKVRFRQCDGEVSILERIR